MKLLRQLNRFRNWRVLIALIHDVIVACVAWVIAFNIRFNFDVPPNFVVSLEQVMIWAIPLQVSAFLYFGMYRGVWRFASLPDLQRILSAIFTSGFLIALILFIAEPLAVVPRSVLIVNPLILVLWLGGSRFFYRVWKDHKLYGHNRRRGKPVLILGAGDNLIGLVKNLARSSDWNVVGVLHDKRKLHGLFLQGAKILGGIDQLEYFATTYHVEDVIVAMPSKAYAKKKHAIELANSLGLRVLTIPSFDDIINEKLNISQIRPVEVEDLLGRDEVTLDDTGLHQLIDHKAVLVTGAGGSIGSELCRQILKFKPNTLICFDMSEFALYTIEQELAPVFKSVKLVFLTGDVKNAHRVKTILETYKPSIVFHAAAYKHVPLMENGNVFEALSNNVIGTHTIALASQLAGVEKFVLVSTDKAVNPTNMMGASKRLAEMVCQGLQYKSHEEIEHNQFLDTETQFVIVRFGNVLGSSGSVIPKFRHQIAKGGPVTITHPEITRYFMSISEATQLVMQAGLMGNGGEIFVLDMGEPVKIVELAKDMIRLSGLHHDEVKIEFTGLRPGEKLFEELLANDEATLPTQHKKLRIAKSRIVDKRWLNNLLKWLNVAQSLTENQIKTEMKFWVEEYNIQNLSDIELDPNFTIDQQPTIH
jgi:FlaA1/EpsC-like NDP-sugar epimerase